MKAVIIGYLDAHSLSMVDAFVAGYNESIAIYNPKNILHIITDNCHITQDLITLLGLQSAIENNCSVAIKSTTGASSEYYQYINNADYQATYPFVTLFMPAGANQVGEIYTDPITKYMCITGAGDVANETADNVEFISHDPIENDEQDYSSFSNPYIAAQILFIAESCNCSIWEARQRAMQTGSEKGIFHETNGYGFINIQDAIEYDIKGFNERMNLKIYNTKSFKPFFLKKQINFILQKKELRSFNHKILARS